jgi:hypothetical protein
LEAANYYGLHIHHPYPDSSVEGHHWQFTRKPKTSRLRRPALYAKILYLRRVLPRS